MLHQGKKSTYKLSAEEKIKQQIQAKEIDEALQKFFKIRHKEKKDLVKLFDFNKLLISMCPDMPTLYNFRKELVEAYTEDNIQELLQKEILFLNKLAYKVPKSYSLWTYRKYCIEKSYILDSKIILYEQDLILCDKMLQKDDRNFHVWNYRNWLISLNPDKIDSELIFLKEKIESNCSNFSAYHYKQKYLSKKNPNLPIEIVKDELEFIKTGLYIDCNDKGIWQYHNWLIQSQKPIYIKQYQFNQNSVKLLFSQKLQYILQSNLKSTQIEEFSDEFLFTFTQDKLLFENSFQLVKTLQGQQYILKFIINAQNQEIQQFFTQQYILLLKNQQEIISELRQLDPKCPSLISQTIFLNKLQQEIFYFEKKDSQKINELICQDYQILIKMNIKPEMNKSRLNKQQMTKSIQI